MPAIATVIIPIAPSHALIAQRALMSAAEQTIPVRVLPIVDDEQRGAGWARNRGLEQVDTPYVVFLDADDELMPTFAERCWLLAQQTNRYVYSDFTDQTGTRIEAPDCAWINEQWHAVTALVPTEWARAVGGFDETLSGGEDSEFFVHLVTEGYCGTRLPEVLMRYNNLPDSRSKRWRNSPAFAAYQQLIKERYTEKGKIVGCCTDPATPKAQPDFAVAGKVLARPRWGGNRRERGQVSGILYPNADRSSVIEIDPRDADARPDHWEVVTIAPPPKPEPTPEPPVAPPYPPINQLAQHVLQIRQAPPPVIPPPPAAVVPTTPDVGKLLRVANKTITGEWRTDIQAGAEYFMPAPVLKRTDDPVFVFPDTDYPSYTDVRRLVELSGFEWITLSEAHQIGYRIDTAILLSPEQYDIDQMGAIAHRRAIWWVLEYGGEYEPDLNKWQGQVWASDPNWLKNHTKLPTGRYHDIQMVIMGSHAGLAQGAPYHDKQYDVTMLAYMTPRREALRQRLNDLSMPTNIYPGYGVERDEQLVNARFMLHAHQRDDTRAIAPQRIALCAAYKLPLIAESVPDAGEYGRYIPFIDYDNLEPELRSQLPMYEFGIPQARAERLHDWLCNEWTFRRCVEEALKS